MIFQKTSYATYGYLDDRDLAPSDQSCTPNFALRTLGVALVESRQISWPLSDSVGFLDAWRLRLRWPAFIFEGGPCGQVALQGLQIQFLLARS